MLKSLKRLGAAILATFAMALPAAASTYSIDYTDLWGGGQPNPTENGWGLNLIQQGDVLFGTMFVYGTDGTPRWYSASNLSSGNGSTFSGTLAETTGPYFGGPWTGTANGTVVGTMTVSFTSGNSGTLTYNVGGVNVTKQISRWTWRAPNLSGKYLGGEVATCNNGNQILIYDTLNVAQSGSSVQMTVNFFNASGVQSVCTYSGTLNTQGRNGTITGTYNCTFGSTAGNAGNFTISNLESSINGFNGNFTGSDQFCSSMTGRFGGVKDVQ